MAGFQLKDFNSISLASINHAKATQNRLTDFEVGSVARTLIEAPAIEVEELYQRIFAGILDAIPTSIYNAFDFELVGEAASQGAVLITFAIPVEVTFTIPAGTVFDAPTSVLKFISSEDVLVPMGALAAIVTVSCQKPGSVGNVGAGSIVRAVNYTLPTNAVVSNDAFTSGRDAQTESERKGRFVEFIRSLSRGTEEAIRYAVRLAEVRNSAGILVEYVSRVGIVERGGVVDVFIYGSGGIASPALLVNAQRIIDGRLDPVTGGYTAGYRAVGVNVRVLPMTERTVPVSLRVRLLTGVAPSLAIRNSIATLLTTEFATVESGEVLLVDQMVGAALTVSGVQKVIPANEENIECEANEVLKLGALTIEWLANA